MIARETFAFLLAILKIDLSHLSSLAVAINGTIYNLFVSLFSLFSLSFSSSVIDYLLVSIPEI